MGGGPSSEQLAAADAQKTLSATELGIANAHNARETDAYNRTAPFFQSRMENGLPYFNALTDAQSGLVARSFAPARAQLMRRMGNQPGLPSGFREQALSNLDAEQGRAYDSSLAGALSEQEAAKRFGAGGLTNQQLIANPLGFYSAAGQGYSSIMNAPLQRPGIAGIVGGLAGGAMSAIPA